MDWEDITPERCYSPIEFQFKRTSIKIRNEQRSNLLIIDVTVETDEKDADLNRRLRDTVDAILEGRPLPDAADSAAPGDHVADGTPCGDDDPDTGAPATEAGEVDVEGMTDEGAGKS